MPREDEREGRARWGTRKAATLSSPTKTSSRSWQRSTEACGKPVLDSRGATLCCTSWTMVRTEFATREGEGSCERVRRVCVCVREREFVCVYVRIFVCV